MATPVDILKQYQLPTEPTEIVNNILERFQWGGTSEQGWNRVNTYCAILPADTATSEASLSLNAILREVSNRLKSPIPLNLYEQQKLLDLKVTLAKTIEYRTSPNPKR